MSYLTFGFHLYYFKRIIKPMRGHFQENKNIRVTPNKTDLTAEINESISSPLER